MNTYRATEYDLGPYPQRNGHLYNDRYASHVFAKFGGELWSLTHGSLIFDKLVNDFVYNVMPSNRTETYKDRTRFNTAEEAFEHWENWKKEIEAENEQDSSKKPSM